jgi:hypothetical protein
MRTIVLGPQREADAPQVQNLLSTVSVFAARPKNFE